MLEKSNTSQRKTKERVILISISVIEKDGRKGNDGYGCGGIGSVGVDGELPAVHLDKHSYSEDNERADLLKPVSVPSKPGLVGGQRDIDLQRGHEL